MNSQTIAAVQAGLLELGYDPGPVDGSWGPRTKAALAEFQRWTNETSENSHNPIVLPTDGNPTDTTLYRLLWVLENRRSGEAAAIAAEMGRAMRLRSVDSESADGSILPEVVITGESAGLGLLALLALGIGGYYIYKKGKL